MLTQLDKRNVSSAMVLAACLSVGPAMVRAGAADAVSIPRYGAVDFMPTSEQAIGFQADGNGWYPGATPAVVEWWDGTPGWGKVIHRGGTGNSSPPFDDSSYKELDLRVFLDRTPKNIIWKIPTPGHTDSQPLVIGDRIVNAYFPHFVVCYDRHTGQELWRDELEMAFLPELQADRKTLGPVPDPKEARKRQTLFEIAWAFAYLSAHLRDFDGEDPGPAEYPRVQKAIEHMNQWRKLLEESDPEAVPLLDEEIALAKRFLAGEHAILGLGQKKRSTDKDFHRKNPQFGGNTGDTSCGGGDLRNNLVTYAQKKLRASLRNAWPGWMPFQCTTGCSDGEIAVMHFYHGQYAAYEVKTGKRLWAWRDPLNGQLTHSEHLVASPRLRGELIFTDLFSYSDKHAPSGTMAVDKRSGVVRWFAPYEKIRNVLTVAVLVDVPLGAGASTSGVTDKAAVLPVVVNYCAEILDQATGKRLGKLPKKGGDWNYALVWGDRVIVGVNAEKPAWTSVFRLKPDGQGGIVGVEEAGFSVRGARFPCARNDALVFYDNQSYDFRTGVLVGNVGALAFHGGDAPSVIGGLHIRGGEPDGDRKYRPRRDGMTVETFLVAEATARPYDGPKLISDRSLLGGAEAPADIFWDKHLAGFDKLRLLAPKKWCGRYGQMISTYFGHYMNGPVAAGDRIYIQGQCFLYCIGPAVKGTPADDPKVVETIRAESDPTKLIARLGDASAQYRYEAVRRIADLRLPITDLEKRGSGSQSAISNQRSAIDILKSLAMEDAYEEIRAAAMLALDACDLAGEAGWQALVGGEFQPCYGSDVNYGKPGHREQQERRARLPLLFRALGEADGVALLSRRWPKAAEDPVQRRALLEIAIAQRWRVEPMLATALSILSNPKPWERDQSLRLLPACFAAMDAASELAIAETLLKAYPKEWTLYPTFARHVKTEQLLAWIEAIALESSHPGSRDRLFRAWQAVGKAALPSMERVRTAVAARDPAKDKLAASYAEAIAEEIAVMKGEKKRFVAGPEKEEKDEVEP